MGNTFARRAASQTAVQTDPHVIRLQAVIDGERHDGRDGHFFGTGRLPVELFLLTIEHLEHWQFQVVASHVATFWRRAILNHPRLWNELEDVDPADLSSVDRVRAVAERSKGGLKNLSLFVNESGEMALEVLPGKSRPPVWMDLEHADSGPNTVAASLRAILREISLSGAKQLTTISLNLKAYAHIDDIEPAYTLIALLAQFSEHSAVNLEDLTILSELRRFPSGSPFFCALPALKRLTLTSDVEEPFGDARLPEFLATTANSADYQVTKCALTSLVLSGTSLMDSFFPAFPALRTIKLYNVKVSNLYALLANSQPSTLWLFGIQSDPPSRFFPAPAPGTADKDSAAILALPYLRDVRLCGRTTPLLWTSPSSTTSDFLTETPLVRAAHFGQQEVYDIDAACDRGEETELPACSRLSTQILSTFFRTSIHLTSLNLAHTNVTPEMLTKALAYASSTLKKLSLRSTQCATDSVLELLHALVPSLASLDVRDSHSPSPATVPALARLAYRLRLHAPLARWLGSFHLVLITDEPSDSDHPESPSLAALQMELRNALFLLSPTQVQLLATTDLVLNDPPNALAFHVCRQEVISLSQRIKSDSGPAAGGAGPGGGGDPNQKKQQQQQQPSARAPASQKLVEDAKVAMTKWQKRREDEWAIKWCQDNDVDLVNAEDKVELAKVVSAIKFNYTDKNEEARKHWGGGVRGHKSIAKLEGRARAAGLDPTKVSHTV
ncbi:hypothetical protein RQP46_006903 [Phenoliferia psychrophenolica]